MLRLRIAEYDEMRRHGEEAYPEECCGVLLGTAIGDQRGVIRVARCRNACKESRRNRYSIEPAELVRVQREARERSLEIVGFYHSHPDHPAQWSQTDLEEAHWIGCSYVITSVDRGTAQQTTSFVLTGTQEEDKRFAQEEIVITEPG